MSGLENIPVSVEASKSAPEAWGNALPILHEIRHGLRRLADSGESSRIDLQALPFGPGDEDRLLHFLGSGEVQAQINALGPTQISETVFPGVWLVAVVTHCTMGIRGYLIGAKFDVSPGAAPGGTTTSR